jgi:hypothetical protein
MFGQPDQLDVGNAPIEYLLQNGSTFFSEDNRKIERWMKTNRVRNVAQDKDAFEELVREFGFDNERIPPAGRKYLVCKLSRRINAIRDEMLINGKIIITKESTSKWSKIKDVQYIDSDASDGC